MLIVRYGSKPPDNAIRDVIGMPGLPSNLAFTRVSRQEFAEMKRLSELQDTRSWTRSLCAG